MSKVKKANGKPQNQCGYNPYKAVVESIAEMCDKYESKMWDREAARDFLNNVKVKCKEANEYDIMYPQIMYSEVD